MANDKGALAIVLHSHMPYVEGFDTWPFGEEWLWEATAMSYLRLLPVLKGRTVTLGVTPVLADQFEAMQGLAGDRFEHFLDATRTQVFKEEREAFIRDSLPDLVNEVNRAEADYQDALKAFNGLQRNINQAIVELGDEVELWGGPATHCLLPLLATRQGIKMQMQSGRQSHERRFGAATGIWLPECAWHPRLAQDLIQAGVNRFCTDQTFSWGEGSSAHLSPVRIDDGLTALPLDWQIINLVWSSEGFPKKPQYRDSFKRTRLDLAPWRNDGAVYDEHAARAQACRDAHVFVAAVQSRLDTHQSGTGRPGLSTFAIDTELLGHWWYEGPWWLEEVFAQAQRVGLTLVTAEQGIADFPATETDCQPSTWGENKDFSTWDAPNISETAWAMRKAEVELVLAARQEITDHSAFARAARELLAMQSSDWAFLQSKGTAGDYPDRRIAGHQENFLRAIDLVAQSDTAKLANRTVCAELASLAPDLDSLARSPNKDK